MSAIPVPRSLPEFQAMFPNEEACERYLFQVRWPNGFVCDHCGYTGGYWVADRRRMDCQACGKGSYLTAGTIMHGSHMPLLIWFYGAFLVTALTPGISAVQLQKQLGLTRQETAFQMLHKLRAGMVNPEREKLEGVVEVDETYMGGTREGGKGGRSLEWKPLVIGAVEVRQKKDGSGQYAGRVRLRVIPDAAAHSLESFIADHIETGSTVMTDGWGGYNGLRRKGYRHIVNITGEPVAGTRHLRMIHLEISNLKTYIRGTYHGRVEEQHLQAYLNEFAFRHNRRFFDVGWGFLRVLQLGVAMRAPTYAEIYAAGEPGAQVHMGDCECDDA